MKTIQKIIAKDDLKAYEANVNLHLSQGWRIVPQSIRAEIKRTSTSDWFNGYHSSVDEAYVCVLEKEVDEPVVGQITP
jgi:hypothetical protein